MSKEVGYIVRPSGCWEWQGRANSNGYCSIQEAYIQLPAHKHFFIKYKGSVPDGLDVCHTCDNRICVNPEHLFVGTRKDNMQDAVSKGRHYHGTRHWHTELVEDDIRYIRSSKLPKKQLCDMYGLSRAGIYKIQNKETWKHVVD